MKIRTKKMITFLLAVFLVFGAMMGLFAAVAHANGVSDNIAIEKVVFAEPGGEYAVDPVKGGVYDVYILLFEITHTRDFWFDDLRCFLYGGDFTQEQRQIFTAGPAFTGNFNQQMIKLENVKYTGNGDELIIRLIYDACSYEIAKDDFGDEIRTLKKASIVQTVSYSLSNDSAAEEDPETPAVVTPRLIVESYNFGGDSVIAGTVFPLKITLKNTSTAVALENIEVKLSPGAAAGSQGAEGTSVGFSLANSANSFFIEKIDPNGTYTINVDVSALASAISASHKINVSFDFEYLDTREEKYDSGSGSNEISIPVFQPDRFEVKPLEPVYGMMEYQEYPIEVGFINKGKSQISNLSVKFVGNNTNGTQEQYIGNLQSGTEDFIDFYLMGMAGMLTGDFVFTYEDANGIEKELLVPFSAEVMEMWKPDPNEGLIVGPMLPEVPEEPTGLPTLAWIGIFGGGAVVILVLIIVIAKKAKAKKSRDEDDDEDF